MQRFEYRVVPAPKKGKKAKGLKTGEDRFAAALSETMNDMAADGWDYLRTDTLPAEERSGLTGRTTVFQNMLVFRREIDAEAAATVTPKVEVAEVADIHAPKLPSASAAQDVPDNAEVRVTAPADKPAHAAE